MNSIKAQVSLFTISLGLVIIILALALAPVISDTSARAMNASVGDTLGMDCSNSSISNFDRAACVAVDLNGFYFIGVMILIGGGVIAAKVLL